MTAVNLFVNSDAAVLLTDAAVIDHEGRLQSIATKVIKCPHLRSAIALTGMIDGEGWHSLKDTISACGSQEALMRLLPSLAMQAHHHVAAELAKNPRELPTETKVRLIVATWSEVRLQPEGYVIGGRETDAPPGMGAGVNGCRRYIQPEIRPREVPQHIDQKSAHRLIEAQRRTRDALGRYVVGGAAELTTVDAAGVRAQVIQTWNDRLGEPIRPGLRPRLSSLGVARRRSI